MDFTSIYWPAALACLIFSMISGSLWFGPKTFFPIWWKAIGRKEADLPSGKPMTWALLIGACAVQVIFMAMLVKTLGAMNGGATLASGAMLGLALWLGLIAPSSLVNKLFPDQLKAWMIESGNHLVNFVVFGAILGAWH